MRFYFTALAILGLGFLNFSRAANPVFKACNCESDKTCNEQQLVLPQEMPG